MTLANWAADRCSRFAHQQALDAVLGVAGPAAAPVPGAHHPAAHVADGLDGELDDVEQVLGERCARQHAADRRGVDRCTCRSPRPGPRPATPGWPRPASTRRHRRCGPAPGPAAPAGRTGRRSRCATGPRAGCTPRSAHRRRSGPGRGGARRCPGGPPTAGSRSSTGSAGGGERLVRRRPGDPGVPGRLRRGDPPPGDLVPRLLPQPGRDPAPRRHLRHPLGERLARAPRVAALPLELHPPLVHRSAARRTSRGRVSTVSCTRSETVPHPGHAAAAR